MNSAGNNAGSVLVVGGGVAGLKAALELAEMGVQVHLLERGSSVGGTVAQLAKQFPTNACGLCQILPRFPDRSEGTGFCLRTSFRHPNVNVITNAEIQEVDGKAGDFRVTYRRRPTFVRQERCTQCGECVLACAVEVRDEFEEKLVNRKAIHTLYPNSTPAMYTVDMSSCTRCGECEKACPVGAIDLAQRDETGEIRVGAAILALGFEQVDPKAIAAYGYGRYPNVVTSIEFERLFVQEGRWGKIRRPSDGAAPHSIAFIQCVGSRDRERPYCSSVCCMYATKEAMMAREYLPESDCQIFYMDLRACGKGYEEYWRKAREQYGVGYIRCRPSEVQQGSEPGGLRIRYEAEDGTAAFREFDLVVLSLGLQPSAGAKEVAGTFGLELNEYGFSRGGDYSSTETNRAGIFVCGAFSEPKDIPETVVQAGDAAARAAAVVREEPLPSGPSPTGRRGDEDGEGDRREEIRAGETPALPAEGGITAASPQELAEAEARVGVFLCGCGGSVSRVVDLERIAAELSPTPSVVHVEIASCLCRSKELGLIRSRVAEHELNRVVVAACSPRLQEATVRREVVAAGLPGEALQWVNAREQCAWVHSGQPDHATAKAGNLIRMAVARARLMDYHEETDRAVQPSALVVGGGIAGLSAALTLAENGIEAHLVEKNGELGGNFRRIRYTLNDDKPQGLLDSTIDRAAANDRIHIHTSSELASLSGSAGDFTSQIAVDGHNGSGHAADTISLRHGAVIVATGAATYTPTEYLFGRPNVLTQVQLEERLAREGAGKAHNFVMIQCVGSRNEERPYCSRVCCAHAVKNALKIVALKPEANVYVLYRDIRTDGFRELYYKQAREAGVLFIRYDEEHKPVVAEVDGELMVTLRDPVLDEEIAIQADVVALSAAVTPNGNAKLAETLGVELGPSGFFAEANPKFRPLDSPREGIFFCGLAHSPMLTEDSISQARGAAARAATLLKRPSLGSRSVVSVVNKRWCAGCGMCVSVCPYEARVLDSFTGVVEVDEAICQGCGACAVACPSGATQLAGFRDRQMLAVLEEATVG